MDPIEFRFDTSKEIAKTNINLLIGENGAGKSHVLKRITEVISGVHENSHSWPFFHKLIVTAYSPFESFYTKTQLLDLLDKNMTNLKEKESQKIEEIFTSTNMPISDLKTIKTTLIWIGPKNQAYNL